MKIIKVIFSRITFMLLAVLVEACIIMAMLHWLGDIAGYISAVLRIASIFVVLGIVKNSRHLAADLMWIFLIMLIPVAGTGIYLFLGADLVTSKEFRKIVSATNYSVKYFKQDEGTLSKASSDFPEYAGQFRYLSDHASFPLYENSKGGFEYFPLGDEGYPVMLEELKKAEKFIFLEYFIVCPGKMWDGIHDNLKQKAAAGLDIRVMYDDLGSFTTLPMSYAKTLQAEGIKCVPFNRISPLLGAVMNHRDHRKILVIDGRTAFSGGVNLADEYINAVVKYGHWKDTVIKVTGEAVWSYTVMFLTHWKALTGSDEDFSEYKAKPDAIEAETAENFANTGEHHLGAPNDSACSAADGYIIPYGDTPLDEDHVGQDVYMNMLNQADKYCYIMTPYLILDNEFVNALILAASRGVDVRIITPGVPDKKTVYGVTRSFYKQLIRGGVKIYEYTPGFVHAKVFVSDDKTAAVGTINLDYRSLYLHFENGTLIIGSEEVDKIKQDIDGTLAKCREVSEKDATYNFFTNVKYSAIRVIAGQL